MNKSFVLASLVAAVALAACGKKEEAPVVEPAPVVAPAPVVEPVAVEQAASDAMPAASDAMAPASAPAAN